MSIFDIFSRNKSVKNLTKEEFYFLRNVTFLNGLNRLELKLFSRLLHRREFEKNEWVFREDYPHTVLYIIAEGNIDIILEKNREEEINLVTLTSEDYFGEVGLFTDSQRTASARAASDAVLYAVSQKEFQVFINEHPRTASKILFQFAGKLSKDLIRTNRKLKAINDPE